MASLSFGAKMGIIAVIFMLPISLLAVLLHLQIHSVVAVYEQELLGVTSTRELRPLFADLETLRLDEHGSAALPAIRRRIDGDFAAAFAAANGPARTLELAGPLGALHDEWLANADSSTLLDDFIALLSKVSDNSRITFDPMLDGYYVGDTMVNSVPSLIDGVARAWVLNARSPLGLHLGTDDRIAYRVLAVEIGDARDRIDHNLSIALKVAPYLAARFDRSLDQAHTTSSLAVDWLDTSQLKSNAPYGDPQDWAVFRKAALAAGFDLYDASIAGLDDVLHRRIQALVRREIATFLSVCVAVAVAAGLIVLTARSMSRQLAAKIALEHEIVERTHVEQQLAHAAYHDKLTGLSNRALLMDRLNEIVQRAEDRPHPWAILFLDLDRFKIINDSLGHVIGDSVLVEAARRFERCVRSGDTLVRLGGDEFIVLIENIEDIADAYEVARRALHALEVPFVVGGREIFTSASIGIATSPSGADRPEDVLRNADIAMYQAKALGKNRYELFTPELLTSAVTRLEIESDLGYALERNEFRLLYQPIIRLSDRYLSGFEALLRWQHPTRGLVGPDQFISIAEENGTIVAIGEWVLREACRQLQAWRTTIANAQNLQISINVSAKQLNTPGFLSSVEQALSASTLDANALNIEITESVLMENANHVLSIVAQIKALGIQIHLDDFGTGYSSLAYLRDFPIDALKIDRSFVSGTNARNPDAPLASIEIVRTIIALAQSLSLTVTAEGIETDLQCEQLDMFGCALGQGYFFAHPLDGAAARDFILTQLAPREATVGATSRPRSFSPHT